MPDGAAFADIAPQARTAALRAAGPFDAILRLAAGRGGLPPLWLRRHTGAVSARFASLLEDAGLRVQRHSEGYYPGREALTAQDVLLLGI